MFGSAGGCLARARVFLYKRGGMGYKQGMQRKGVFQTTAWCVAVLGAVGVSACRSPLYYAARRGDAAAVEEELYRGADPQGRTSPVQLLWQVPAALAALPVDAAQLVPFSLTGGYFGTVDWNDCSLVRRALFFGSQTPREAAMERGHFEVAQLLSDNRDCLAPEAADGLVFTFDLRHAQAAGHAYSSFGKAREGRERSALKPLRAENSAVYNGCMPADFMATRLSFEYDNRATLLLCPQGTEQRATAAYARTGGNTARISVESAATPCTYTLHFTTPRSGTATYEYAGIDAGESFFIRIRNIEFRVTDIPLPEELSEKVEG